MRKAKLHIILVMVISFLIAISLSQALDMGLKSPESVSLNEEFSVEVYANFSEKYDVKIYVHNSSDDKITQKEIISSTLNQNEWKDSWYYILSVLPEIKIYRLKIERGMGQNLICLRVRKPGQTSASKAICNLIEIINSENKNINSTSPKEENKSLVSKKTEEENKIDNSDLKASVSALENKTEKNENLLSNLVMQEKIELNPVKKQDEIQEFISPAEKTRIYISSAFSIFAVILTVLIALRKL